jgi:hypothetical protein
MLTYIWPKRPKGETIKSGYRTTYKGGTSQEIYEACLKLQAEKRLRDYDIEVHSMKQFVEHLNKYGYCGESVETIIKVNGWQAGRDGLTVCTHGNKKIFLDIETNQYQLWER